MRTMRRHDFSRYARRARANECADLCDVSRTAELSRVPYRLARCSHDQRASARRAGKAGGHSAPTTTAVARRDNRSPERARRARPPGQLHSRPRAGCRHRPVGLRGLSSAEFLLELPPGDGTAALPPVQFRFPSRGRVVRARDEVRILSQHRGVLPFVPS